jgi:transcriptional regulator with XRE-family HTH domain
MNEQTKTGRSLGAMVAAKRKERGLTYSQLARLVLRPDGKPVSPTFLNDIEHDRRRPGPQVLAALAAALGLSTDDLHLAAGQLPPDLVAGRVTRGRLQQVLDAIQRIYGARN